MPHRTWPRVADLVVLEGARIQWQVFSIGTPGSLQTPGDIVNLRGVNFGFAWGDAPTYAAERKFFPRMS
jgi:hypothetical protein